MKNVIYKRKVVSVMELEKGMMYHIRLKKGDVGRYVLLPGDPFRTDLIATYFDEPKLIAHNREHKTWVGKLDGVPVAVTSTGMGCPSAAIALEELIKCGADTFIRVGTAGRVCDAAFDETLDGVINTAAGAGMRVRRFIIFPLSIRRWRTDTL